MLYNIVVVGRSAHGGAQTQTAVRLTQKSGTRMLYRERYATAGLQQTGTPVFYPPPYSIHEGERQNARKQFAIQAIHFRQESAFQYISRVRVFKGHGSHWRMNRTSHGQI